MSTVERVRRAMLGIDGNCGFAGLGDLPTAPQREWVFVEIVGDPGDRDAQIDAIAKAWAQLKANVAPERITYALDVSHPRYCP